MDVSQSALKKYDGSDEIVFSGAFNVYENILSVKGLYGFDFKFVFEESLPVLPSVNHKEISISGDGKDVTITLTAKIRNTLGSGTSNKIPVVVFKDGRTLLFSLYGSKIGDNTPALNVTLSFYLR